MPGPIVTLTTDYGEEGAYVAILKGALLRACPAVRLVDVNHRLASDSPFDAALLLLRVFSYYPAGTVHLVGLDRGHGPDRALIAQMDGQFFAGMDNGVLSLALARGPTRVWAVPVHPRTTFTARDALVGLVGGLFQGHRPADLGQPIEDWERLSLPVPGAGPAGIEGEVLLADRFGNLITNLTSHEAVGLAAPRVTIAGTTLAQWRRHYGEAAPGELFLLWGAEGWLEIACAGGSAAERLAAGRGAKVVLR